MSILLVSFLGYVAYRKHLNNEFNKKFNLEFNKQWELEYFKTHTRFKSDLNGVITYSFHDSTKTIKTQVNKKEYEDFRYSVFWDTDSLELSSGRPFVQIIDITRTKELYEGIKKIKVVYREDLNSTFKDLPIETMSIGFGSQFSPTKKGIGQVITEIESQKGKIEKFEFKYVVY